MERPIERAGKPLCWVRGQELLQSVILHTFILQFPGLELRGDGRKVGLRVDEQHPEALQQGGTPFRNHPLTGIPRACKAAGLRALGAHPWEARGRRHP